MTETFRIQVDFSQAAFEVAGTRDFVEEHAKRLEDDLRHSVGVSPVADTPRESSKSEPPAAFGELLTAMSSSRGTDRVLLAGWYIGAKSGDGLFTTAEINRILKDQGIRLGNPSQTVANLQKAKLIFRDGGQYKVSRSGLERLSSVAPISPS